MLDSEKYTDKIVSALERIVNIPSPTGYTARAAREICSMLSESGYSAEITNRGNVLCRLGGEGDPLIIAAHFDTLGGITRSLKPKGRVRIAKVGGLAMGSYEAENCTLFTRDGKAISGTFQMNEASSHVSGASLAERKRTEEEMEVVLDCDAVTVEELSALGVAAGDFVAFDPRFTEADGGYIKSRFLDDKASCAVLLAYAEALRMGDVPAPKRTVWLLFTSHEEVGTGASSGLPEASEFLSVDMGCVGADLGCTERMVSICVADGGGPYDYGMVTRMKNICRHQNLPHSLDVYPHYGSDAGAAVRAGYHMRAGCIGPGVYASHGYERTHRDGLFATFCLVAEYAALAPQGVYEDE